MTTILEADGLAKSWGGRTIFSGISLSVERGLLAVAGKNGSGKTTLLKILASLLRPDAGAMRIRVEGEEATEERRRRAVGWEGPDLTFYEDLTAEENLLFFRRAGGMPVSGEEIRARLSELGLPTAGNRFVGALSTGMKQRLRLAFATLFDPSILLLDEPMTGLDAAGREHAFRIVEERRRSGAVVLASNDPRDLERADRVLELPGPADEGR